MSNSVTINKKSAGPLGFLIGIVIVFIGIALLWWNEGRTVRNIKGIAEVEDNYISVSSDKIDSKNEGKLVITNGNITINDVNPLTDSQFGVSVKSLKLMRIVEMYQWDEECESDDDDDEETCTYKKEWSSELIDSSEFEKEHQNPTSMPYDSMAYYAEDVNLGAYKLNQDLYQEVSTNKKYTDLTEDVATKNGMHVNGIYYVNYEESPVIGSVRISFVYNDTTSATVLAVQSGNSFETYTSKSKVGYYELYESKMTGPEVIQALRNSNNATKWLFRILGTILVIVGLLTFISPIGEIAKYVPILGNIVNFATSTIAFLIGLAISLLVIAVAWIRFRPIIGIILFVAIVLIIVLVIKLKSKNAKKIKE